MRSHLAGLARLLASKLPALYGCTRCEFAVPRARRSSGFPIEFPHTMICCDGCQREAEKPVHNRTMWGNMVDRSLRMWRFTLRLPHYIVRFIGFKLQQVSSGEVVPRVRARVRECSWGRGRVCAKPKLFIGCRLQRRRHRRSQTSSLRLDLASTS